VSDAGTPASDAATVEALRRLKAVEAEWDAKLRDARDAAARTVQRSRDESEATVKAVAAENETERNRLLEAGQQAADREAERIGADGARAADAVRADRSKRPAERADAIVRAVLDPFASD
jgi:vacuolar-type H+-ATPase subunit H